MRKEATSFTRQDIWLESRDNTVDELLWLAILIPAGRIVVCP